MSIRIWEEIAASKKQVENQRKIILNAFKRRSVEDQVGTIKAEKLFKPITKLLGEKPEEKVKTPFPNYGIDDQTRNFKNELPFGEGDYEKEMVVEEDPYEDLKPFEDEMHVPATGSDQESEWDEIIPLPKKSSPAPEEITPLPDPDPVPEDFGEEILPGEKALPSYSQAIKDDKPPKYKKPRDEEANDLSTLTKFLKNSKGKPNSRITTQKSKFFGMSVEEARYQVREIYTERAKKVLTKGDRKAIGQKSLGPYEGKSNKEMRAMIAEFEKGKDEAKIGSGFNSLVNRLSLGISSILAGNTSVKLKNEIASLAKHLTRQGIISNEQKK